MFNVTKSSPPAEPFAYNDPAVVALVRNDFHDKCYLCEEKPLRHLEVEHFYPQAYYPHLVNNWYNLLCICEKCNKIRPKEINTKNENEVLNCWADDVETAITLRYDETADIVEIKPNDHSVKTANTTELLQKIHNGLKTTSLSYVDLRRLIAEELAELSKEIEYFETTVLKSVFKARISKRLSRTACFSAIKRTFIQEKHPTLINLLNQS